MGIAKDMARSWASVCDDDDDDAAGWLEDVRESDGLKEPVPRRRLKGSRIIEVGSWPLSFRGWSLETKATI